jgi:zinc transport system ATP-binding protein
MTPPAVALDAITKHYGKTCVLRGVTLAIPSGSFTAIIGPNGAGKSTLLHIIAGLVEPGSGRATVLGRPPRQVPGGAMGFVPQMKTLDRTFPALAVELVISGIRQRWPWRIRAADRAQATAALAAVGIADLADRPVRQLSGGELQRAYLARCLVRRPALIVLDEPGAGLDISGEADMYHILSRFQSETGATVVMITHDWEGARVHASHALLLDRAVLAFGAPAEVLDETSLLRVFGHAGHVEATHGDHGHD